MSPSSNPTPARPGSELAELRMRIITELLKQYNGPTTGLVETAKGVEAYILGEDPEQDQPDAS